jgi:hypothetical protein
MITLDQWIAHLYKWGRDEVCIDNALLQNSHCVIYWSNLKFFLWSACAGISVLVSCAAESLVCYHVLSTWSFLLLAFECECNIESSLFCVIGNFVQQYHFMISISVPLSVLILDSTCTTVNGSLQYRLFQLSADKLPRVQEQASRTWFSWSHCCFK